MIEQRDRPETEVVITPQMIEAGALALAESGEASSTYLAEVVFRAMMRAKVQFQDSGPVAAAGERGLRHRS
jgi:hypothetical protein